MTKKRFSFIVMLLLVVSLPLTTLFSQQQQQTEQHAAGVVSYAANAEYDPGEQYGTYTQAHLANPNIMAVDVNMQWSVVEPQQGVFNWAPGDKVAADWAAKGKKIIIVVQYIHVS